MAFTTKNSARSVTQPFLTGVTLALLTACGGGNTPTAPASVPVPTPAPAPTPYLHLHLYQYQYQYQYLPQLQHLLPRQPL
jgi:hypothetical protein